MRPHGVLELNNITGRSVHRSRSDFDLQQRAHRPDRRSLSGAGTAHG